MSILDKREYYRPFEYQKAYDYYIKQQSVHWTKDEINLSSDLQDWELNLTEGEKAVVGGILKGFTQMEILVGDYWRNVANWLPKPEIAMMASCFSYFETIHQSSYAMINEQLNLDDFQSFIYDPGTMEKLEYFVVPKSNDPKDIATSLAIFSAFGEGCMLFSSFAVLLSFQMENHLKGIGQLINFSIRDENIHSEGGCYLFNTMCLENPGLREEVKESIIKASNIILDLEVNFLSKLFSKGSVRTISYEQLINFVKHRLNSKLSEIGYEENIFTVDKEILSQVSWFDMLSAGREFQDFFAGRVTEYTEYNSSPDEMF